MYQHYIKRFIDIVVSIIAIIILVPVYLIIALIVWKEMGRPILFSQMRIGKDEKQPQSHLVGTGGCQQSA